MRASSSWIVGSSEVRPGDRKRVCEWEMVGESRGANDGGESLGVSGDFRGVPPGATGAGRLGASGPVRELSELSGLVDGAAAGELPLRLVLGVDSCSVQQCLEFEVDRLVEE